MLGNGSPATFYSNIWASRSKRLRIPALGNISTHNQIHKDDWKYTQSCRDTHRDSYRTLKHTFPDSHTSSQSLRWTVFPQARRLFWQVYLFSRHHGICPLPVQHHHSHCICCVHFHLPVSAGSIRTSCSHPLRSEQRRTSHCETQSTNTAVLELSRMETALKWCFSAMVNNCVSLSFYMASRWSIYYCLPQRIGVDALTSGNRPPTPSLWRQGNKTEEWSSADPLFPSWTWSSSPAVNIQFIIFLKNSSISTISLLQYQYIIFF